MATPNAYALALDVYDVGARGFSIMEVITSLGWLAGGVLASRLNYRGDRNTYVFVSMLGMAACLSLWGSLTASRSRLGCSPWERLPTWA